MTRLKFKFSRRISILLHIVNIIIVVISIDLILLDGNFLDNLLPTIKYLPVSCVTFYFTNLWMTPELYFKKKYFHFFALFFLTVFVAGVITTVIHYTIDLKGLGSKNSSSILNILAKSIFLQALFLSRNFTAHIALINSENSIKQILKEKARTKEELQFLIFQIQPHFFLNTINNLYSLALDNSKKMPQALVHLADLLRHIVYNAKDNKTLLYKEIEAVYSYMKILQLGFEKPLNIRINTQHNTTALVPCYALLTLVEGAVKHSKIGKISNSYITINSIVSDKNIEIIVKNSIATNKNEDEFGGCGLDNLKKQFEILYPSENILTTQIQNNTFAAILNIPIQL